MKGRRSEIIPSISLEQVMECHMICREIRLERILGEDILHRLVSLEGLLGIRLLRRPIGAILGLIS
jgi:hypothetical protein